MISATSSTGGSPITKLNSKKVQIAKVCHEIDDGMDKLGDENYCPYEDLEAIHEKLQKMTD